jgi:hypothetical protein
MFTNGGCIALIKNYIRVMYGRKEAAIRDSAATIIITLQKFLYLPNVSIIYNLV